MSTKQLTSVARKVEPLPATTTVPRATVARSSDRVFRRSTGCDVNGLLEKQIVYPVVANDGLAVRTESYFRQRQEF